MKFASCRSVSLKMCLAATVQASVVVTPECAEMDYGTQPLLIRAEEYRADTQPAWAWTMKEPAGADLVKRESGNSGLFSPPKVDKPTVFLIKVAAAGTANISAVATVMVYPDKSWPRISKVLGPDWHKTSVRRIAGNPGWTEDADSKGEKEVFRDIRQILFVPEYSKPFLAGEWLVLDDANVYSVNRRSWFSDEPEFSQIVTVDQFETECPEENKLSCMTMFNGRDGEPPTLLVAATTPPAIGARDGKGFTLFAGGHGMVGAEEGDRLTMKFGPPAAMAEGFDRGQVRLLMSDPWNSTIRQIPTEGKGCSRGGHFLKTRALAVDETTGDCLLGHAKGICRLEAGTSEVIALDPLPWEGKEKKPAFGVAKDLSLQGSECYFLDTSNQIRRLNLKTGELTTLLGDPGNKQSVGIQSLPDWLLGIDPEEREDLKCPVALAFNPRGECRVATRGALYRISLPYSYEYRDFLAAKYELRIKLKRTDWMDWHEREALKADWKALRPCDPWGSPGPVGESKEERKEDKMATAPSETASGGASESASATD